MVEFPFLGVGEIHRLHHFPYQPLRQGRVSRNDGARDAQPLRILDGTLVALRHAHGKCRHVVHEEVGEMLGGDDHQGIGSRGREFVAQAAITAEENRRRCRDRPAARGP